MPELGSTERKISAEQGIVPESRREIFAGIADRFFLFDPATGMLRKLRGEKRARKFQDGITVRGRRPTGFPDNPFREPSSILPSIQVQPPLTALILHFSHFLSTFFLSFLNHFKGLFDSPSFPGKESPFLLIDNSWFPFLCPIGIDDLVKS
jgi:hypothetical protein